MRIPAFRIVQSGRKLYLAQIVAADLVNICITDEWNPAIGWDLDRQGYQRTQVKDHYKAIGQFLKNDVNPFMPTGALLSAREHEQGVLPFDVVFDGGDHAFGYLEIPEGRYLYIVDYQHRWRGFMYAMKELEAKHLSGFVVPSIIMAEVPRHVEISQFYLINSKQRRIDTDLALTLLQTLAPASDDRELENLAGAGKRYRVRGTRLTFRIARLTTGPWIRRIQQPHDINPPEAVLAIKSFVDSLHPIVSSRSPVSRRSDEELIDILVSYWQAIAHLMPDAFADPRNHQIQRTHGVFTMHIVAAKGVLKVCSDRGDFSEACMASILQGAPSRMNSDFWKTKGPVTAYGGSSGHRALAREILGEMGLSF